LEGSQHRLDQPVSLNRHQGCQFSQQLFQLGCAERNDFGRQP
jgi:hypothetical protein